MVTRNEKVKKGSFVCREHPSDVPRKSHPVCQDVIYVRSRYFIVLFWQLLCFIREVVEVLLLLISFDLRSIKIQKHRVATIDGLSDRLIARQMLRPRTPLDESLNSIIR